MSYVPNIWLMNELHRRIVSASSKFSEYNLFIRPTRRHIFSSTYRVTTRFPEYFKPCFAILCEKKDPDKKPSLVIEADPEGVSDTLKNLYDQHGILWVYVYQDKNEFVLECFHRGTDLQIRERGGDLYKLLSAPLSWHEKKISFSIGQLIQSHCERVFHEAVKDLSPAFHIQCHHQVPLGWVLGKKNDLSPEEVGLVNQEIDAVITQNYDADADCAVILPVKIDIYDTHKKDRGVKAKDEAVKQLCAKYEVPLLTITVTDDETFVFGCPVLGIEDMYAKEKDATEWAEALAPFLGKAIKWAGRGF